jgi:hypothetical protein
MGCYGCAPPDGKMSESNAERRLELDGHLAFGYGGAAQVLE